MMLLEVGLRMNNGDPQSENVASSENEAFFAVAGTYEHYAKEQIRDGK